MVRELIQTKKAPVPKGPYSQGVRVGNFVFVSGQGPFDPETGKVIGSDVKSQTHQTLQNIKAVIEEAGFSMHDVVHMRVFLKTAADLPKIDDVYKGFFARALPAVTTLEASFVLPAVLVNIDAVAYRDQQAGTQRP